VGEGNFMMAVLDILRVDIPRIAGLGFFNWFCVYFIVSYIWIVEDSEQHVMCVVDVNKMKMI
jgi:hypothetical protein